ncbi:MAG: HPr(Ser) kinase/phosphatase [Spirochaetes bacterium]|nr:HPr(Ser) kinase/phosphatase [Spirochaetota bacterium]
MTDRIKQEITIKEIIKIGEKEHNLKLVLKAGEKGLGKKVSTPLINRPGITFAGYYSDFAHDRIQILGRGEAGYIKGLDQVKKMAILEKFFSYVMPCCIFSHNQKVDKDFLNLANKRGVPVLICTKPTGDIIDSVTHLLQEYLSPRRTYHGVLLEVFGTGVLILGKSGVGKSECALELITRGHRLIADDVVLIKKLGGSILSGSGLNLVQHYMEIRGLGIIDVKNLFGAGSVRERKRIELVVMLEEWKRRKQYDRLGMENRYYDILDVKIPLLLIPVKPGRNIPIIIETASKNERLKKMGINAPIELDKKLFGISDK